MKHIIILVLMTLLGYLPTNAQNEIVYGDLDYSGFKGVKKGAFWKTRPEAKQVYEGGYPSGVNVYTLTEDYFVSFLDSAGIKENNGLDINYIIVRKGQKVYFKDGYLHLAYCGNRIGSMRPVAIKPKIIEVPVPVYVRDTFYQLPPPTQDLGNILPPPAQACCPTGLSVDDVVKLWKAFSEAQTKINQPEEKWMFTRDTQSDDYRYDWRAQQRQYQQPYGYGYQRPSFWDLANRFFIHFNINVRDRQAYIPSMERAYMGGGRGGNGNNGNMGGGRG